MLRQRSQMTVPIAAQLAIAQSASHQLELHLSTEQSGIWVLERSQDLDAWLPAGSLNVQNGAAAISIAGDQRAVFYRAAYFSGEPSDGFIWVDPGTFVMGSSQFNRNERPAHQVTISRGFWIARYEATQAEFIALMTNNPSAFTNRGPSAPVESVSWFDAVEYCTRLTAAAQARNALPDGYVYGLPTEAEWEYACRAGTQTSYSFGSLESLLGTYAWVADISDIPHPVGQKQPNPWGLFDMHGNVFEWCVDAFDTYAGGSETDPVKVAVNADDLRVFRGGYVSSGGEFDGTDPAALQKSARSSFRGNGSPWVGSSARGFRVALAYPLNR